MFEDIQAFSVASDDYFENTSGFDRRARGNNEDDFCFGRDFLVVIDGATGLKQTNRLKTISSASWLSSRLSELVKTELGNGTRDPISNILCRCATTIKQELDVAGYDSNDGSYPSASISVARLIDGKLDCYALGDVTILLRNKRGELVTFMDCSVPDRDETVVAWMTETAKRLGITISETRTLASDRLLKNRREMNTEQGYWIFEPTGAGVEHAMTASFDVDTFTDIALMSDGFYEAYSRFSLEQRDEGLFVRLRNGAASDIARKLRRKEREDFSCDAYPRLKPADDATVLYAHIMSSVQ